MPRLIAFVKEAMRMYSIVPVTSRRLKSPKKFGDVVLPAGLNIDINIHMIHHHPDVWPDHQVFYSDT
jgi:cytochrome P450